MRYWSLLATALAASSVTADAPLEFWPGADYDPSVPTIEAVVGRSPSERITWSADAVRYLERLARAESERMAVHRYTTSWEGPELVYAVTSSAENMARIDEVQAGMQRLRSRLSACCAPCSTRRSPSMPS